MGATSPLAEDVAVGRAVFSSATFDQGGGWEQIVRLRKGWGQLDDDFALPAGDFYCAHPDYPFGTRLTIVNAVTGTVIHCAVVDTVAPWDVARWRANAVIELSYAGFCAVDAQEENRVMVYQEVG